MGRDYYKILEVPRLATDDEIKRAYRRMAMRYHPDKNKSPEAEEKFKEIAEAYDVLGNKTKRNIYDRYRQQGLKNGMGEGSCPFSFQDPRETFKAFFGESNPLGDFDNIFMDCENSPGPSLNNNNFNGTSYGFSNFQRRRNRGGCSSGGGSRGCGVSQTLPQDPPVVHDVRVSLEEIATGCTKKMKITRKRRSPCGLVSSSEDKILVVEIKKGWKEGTKITFAREGDESPGRIPADVVFMIKDMPHSIFQRDGSDIIYSKTVTLKEALAGCTLQIPTIDGRTISSPCCEIITPNSEKRIRNEGLPIPKQGEQKGDLVIKFTIKFPEFLDNSQKAAIKNILP